ncbi:hypothetical protein E8K88_02605 [Lampropedia aestuarii]|uniref:Uncharacterized protein n=1 Tax=Lampropedia aestuarii TaxID=2562762 RepID=A0A4S5BXK7_9BURK|nr:hypothetical protein [Lampropedia aestuarii]THJ36173.1 hypothetical protein E8K88_02605 [Lampropedia aestuarii]
MYGLKPRPKATPAEQPRLGLKSFRNGGPIRGPGTGTSDSIQTTMPEGSYVMPADSSLALGHENLMQMGNSQSGVPVAVSNGEHELPPEQVHAIGVQALDQIKAATHQPVGGLPGQQPQEPQRYFANGGQVGGFGLLRRATGGVVSEDERQRQNTGVAGAPGVQRTGSSYSDAPRAPAAQQSTQPAAPQQAPANNAPRGFGIQRSGNSFSDAPKPAAAEPRLGMPSWEGRQSFPATHQRAAAPAPQTPTTSLADQIPNETRLKAPVTQPAGASALGAQAQADRQAVGGVVNKVKGWGADAGAAVADAATMIPRGLAGAYDSAVIRPMRAAGFNAAYLSPALTPAGADVSSPTPFSDLRSQAKQSAEQTQAVSTAAPQAPAANSNARGLGPLREPQLGLQNIDQQANRAIGFPSIEGLGSPAATARAAQQGTEVALGAYRHGRGQYSDDPNGMNLPRGLGSPSTTAQAAAEAGAYRGNGRGLPGYTAPAGAAAAEQPSGFGFGGTMVVDAGPFSAEQRASRERRMDMNHARWAAQDLQRFGRGVSGRSAAGVMTAGLGNVGEERRQNARIAAEQATGETEREARRQLAVAQEAGQNQRAALAQAGANQRDADANAVQRERLGLERDGQAYEQQRNQPALEREQAIAGLQQELLAEGTAEKRRGQIAERLRTLTGQQDGSDWRVQVTPQTKNADGSTTEGSVIRYNQRSGQVERVEGAEQIADAPANPKDRVVGRTYRGGNGTVATWNGKQWSVMP